jgi:integrase
MKKSNNDKNRFVLTPEEFMSLAIAVPPQHRASIVLQAFCGLRSVEAIPSIGNGMKGSSRRGIHGEDIDWVNNQIRMSNVVSKSGYPRIIPLTPTARAWLAWAGVHPGQIGPVYGKNLAEVREFRTGWPKDALRYSYGCYQIAIMRSLPQVAEEMGSSETMLENYYDNSKSREEGEAWFALRPPEEIQP